MAASGDQEYDRECDEEEVSNISFLMSYAYLGFLARQTKMKTLSYAPEKDEKVSDYLQLCVYVVLIVA